MGKQIIPIYKRIYVGLNPNYHNLPSEYTEVAWLGSTGTQWIDTGVSPTISTIFDIGYLYPNVGTISGRVVFGSRSSNNAFMLSSYKFPPSAINSSEIRNGYLRIGYSNNNSSNIRIPQLANVKNILSCDIDGYVYLNGTKVYNTPLTKTALPSYSFYLFKANVGSSGANDDICEAGTKIYYFKLWDNNTLVRHFIPCFRNSDVAGGMYDIVNNVFYPNANQQGKNFNVGATIPKYITYSTLPTYVSGADVNTQRIIKTLPSYVKEETELQAGFYSATDELLLGWNESGVDVETDYSDITYVTGNSGYKIITDYNSTHSSNPITKVIISNNVNKLGVSAFRGCSSLTSITIPNSVTSIGYGAFAGYSSLTSITCKATTPPTIQSSTFTNVPATCPIYVPAGSVNAYKSASNWSARASYIQAIPE